MAAAKIKEQETVKTGTSNGHITDLKQYILETFNIYGIISMVLYQGLHTQISIKLDCCIRLGWKGFTNTRAWCVHS
jgi:hypothetical protein